MRIGIFGGSFNPIHNGHIALAHQLRRLGGLDEVWLMVSPQNPLKHADGLLDEQLRYQMVRLALHGEEGLVASDYELHLPRPSYTWHTLCRLRRDYPSRAFILLIGGDNWASFDRWYHADDILRHHEVIVYPRRGYDAGASADSQSPTLPPNVHLADMELLDVASTDIRQRLHAGQSISDSVPRVIEPLVRRLYV